MAPVVAVAAASAVAAGSAAAAVASASADGSAGVSVAASGAVVGSAVAGTVAPITAGSVAVAVGASVAAAGMIGFVGIVVPHVLRLIAGADHKMLLPASALLGAALLVAADAVARTIAAPAELPIGILTAAIGAPFFLWLLLRRQGGMVL